MVVHAAFGGSTNLLLHIPAIAHAAGLKRPTVEDWISVNRRVPRLVSVLPNGPIHHPTVRVFLAGGVPEVMLHLRRLGLLKTDVLTVSGQTLGENLDWWEKSERRVRASANCCTSTTAWTPTKSFCRRNRRGALGMTGTLVFPRGNLAPEGSVVKATAIDRRVCSTRTGFIGTKGRRGFLSARRMRWSRSSKAESRPATSRADRHRADGHRHGGNVSGHRRAETSAVRQTSRVVDGRAFLRRFDGRVHRPHRPGRFGGRADRESPGRRRHPRSSLTGTKSKAPLIWWAKAGGDAVPKKAQPFWRGAQCGPISRGIPRCRRTRNFGPPCSSRAAVHGLVAFTMPGGLWNCFRIKNRKVFRNRPVPRAQKNHGQPSRTNPDTTSCSFPPGRRARRQTGQTFFGIPKGSFPAGQIGCQRKGPSKELSGRRAVEQDAAQTQARFLCRLAQCRQFTDAFTHECGTVNRAFAGDNQVRLGQTFLQSAMVGEQTESRRQARTQKTAQAKAESSRRAGPRLVRDTTADCDCITSAKRARHRSAKSKSSSRRPFCGP